jgi:hypothetical protein
MSKTANFDLSYKGYPIGIDSQGRFVVTLEEDGDEKETRVNDTYEGLKAAIDRWDGQKEKLKKAKFEAVALIDENGAARTLTGLHAGHGRIITKPPADRYSQDGVFLDCNAGRKAVAEVIRLNEELGRAEAWRSLFRINPEPGSYGDDADKRLEALKKNIADVRKNAEKADKGTLKQPEAKKARVW